MCYLYMCEYIEQNHVVRFVSVLLFLTLWDVNISSRVVARAIFRSAYMFLGNLVHIAIAIHVTEQRHNLFM